MACRTGRHRTGRGQRAAHRSHQGGRSRQHRDRHRSSPAGHRHRRRSRRGHPPGPPGPARCDRGHRGSRGGSGRGRRRPGLERNRAGAVGRGARRCRGLIPAGRTGAAPARRSRRHDLRLRRGRPLAAGRSGCGQLRRRPADSAHTHRDPAGRAVLPHGSGHRRRVPRLVRGHEPPRGRPHRALQRADPHRLTGRRRADRHRQDHTASIHRRPHRPRRRDRRPQPCPARSRRHREPGRAAL